MKLVINNCWGGFGLSEKGLLLYAELSGQKVDNVKSNYDAGKYPPRNDVHLVKVVETLGDEASSDLADLKIIDIPNDVAFDIYNYDGIESVHEHHRVWQLKSELDNYGH